MRPGAFLVNCARGGLVDEAALLERSGRGPTWPAPASTCTRSEPVAADDPLPRHPKVVATPHLGASTVEAQANVAVQVAERGAGRAGRAARPVRGQRARACGPKTSSSSSRTSDLVVMLGQAGDAAGRRARALGGDQLSRRDRRAQRRRPDRRRGPGPARADLGHAGQSGQRAAAGPAARAGDRRDALEHARRTTPAWCA